MALGRGFAIGKVAQSGLGTLAIRAAQILPDSGQVLRSGLYHLGDRGVAAGRPTPHVGVALRHPLASASNR